MKRLMIAVCVIAFVLSISIQGSSAQEDAKQRIFPKKVERDANYDGKPDRTEYYNEAGEIAKAEIDNNGDAIIDETIFYEKEKPVKSERDTNKDGKPDMWINY